MEELINLKNSIGLSSEQMNIPIVIFNFLVSFIVSLLLRYFYLNFSNSLTSKLHIGTVIPTLSSVVFLVIVIVKSSLALSLGLVGALSIVRFRTPIKEPEELVYLFLSIAIGLGYGAGYPLITTILIMLILSFNYFLTSRKKISKQTEYNLVIDKVNQDLNLDELINNVSLHSETIKFIRIDSDSNNHTIVLLVTLKSDNKIDQIINKFKSENTNISFFEAKTNW
ncbi:DUF4956 domain-containing protein [Flavobacteriaceae bacterium]|nr:DUF4956 domain-containing protein [Flavobacteriaceae bacterium]